MVNCDTKIAVAVFVPGQDVLTRKHPGKSGETGLLEGTPIYVEEQKTSVRQGSLNALHIDGNGVCIVQ